jgi:hydrogenase expression/formation protein HypE
LGLDPLYVANEGVFLTIVSPKISETVIKIMQENPKCSNASYIGKVTSDYPKKVIVRSGIGGRRVVSMLIGEQLPRIC